jgi:predicted DNA-binding transcriptional regulator AlpA
MKKPFKRPPPRRTRPVKVTEPRPATAPAKNKRFIFKGEVLERVGGISGVCLWRWMRDGKFPVARSVGGRMAWLESDIDEWMESRPLRNYKSRQLA